MDWNPRYVLYAASHAQTPREMLAMDRCKYPGGPMAGYMHWIGEAWRQWHAERGRPPDDVHTDADHVDFDAWLHQRNLTELSRLVTGDQPTPRLADVVQQVHRAGGAVLDLEPAGNPVLLLDFETLDSDPSAPQILAGELATAIEEHHLPLQDLAEEARRLGTLPPHWEERLTLALMAQGLGVYSSRTRFAAYPLDERVQFHFTGMASPEFP